MALLPICSGYNFCVIMEPLTLDRFGHGISMVWAAVGPLCGVLVGAGLSRSWDRRKWLNDNRKQEFRELMETLSEAASGMISRQISRNWGEALTEKEAEQVSVSHMASLKVIKNRIFIAEDVKEMNLFNRWNDGIHAMRMAEDVRPFEGMWDQVSEELIARATR